ncbi:hypothetical protein [Geodermatophilus sp. CPCC 205506]|uniref:hypothetical protein n=1 Tax=Geodermatophilus sp. CPCC 205506 TaxID=2936596 RepID=UPI003EECBCC1
MSHQNQPEHQLPRWVEVVEHLDDLGESVTQRTALVLQGGVELPVGDHSAPLAGSRGHLFEDVVEAAAGQTLQPRLLWSLEQEALMSLGETLGFGSYSSPAHRANVSASVADHVSIFNNVYLWRIEASIPRSTAVRSSWSARKRARGP